MKNILTSLIAVLAMVVFAGVALAQGSAPAGSTGGTGTQSTAPPKAEKKATPKVKTATGELTAADANAGTAKVKSKDKELTFTEATPNGKESLAKLKVGDTVKVAYAESEGKLTLRSIAKTKPPTTAKPAEPTEKTAKTAETKPATK